jgi:flavin-binding protein dodecin
MIAVQATRRKVMPNHIYKHIELTGTSGTTIEDAIQSAVGRAAKTVRNMRWVEVLETRGHIDGGKVLQWQVTIKIGFTLEE